MGVFYLRDRRVCVLHNYLKSGRILPELLPVD